ncbi:hypothetical protein TNIN_190741 [Trichonephila inaurata madagascariensis]|uniref:Uncharacterized protein n=1 Tax=Trichonephila inaurata madagascariensis TaxID=2747483 RepID=A0A8X6XNN5_9ARAC|nr:hypothetical protein TNIN_190741 [Trichonephila inaurata madagascariensis]
MSFLIRVTLYLTVHVAMISFMALICESSTSHWRPHFSTRQCMALQLFFIVSEWFDKVTVRPSFTGPLGHQSYLPHPEDHPDKCLIL